MVQELGLVRGHVDTDRAVAAARLARQAEIQRVADLVRPPPVGDQVATHHLGEEPRPATGGVLFLAGRLEARAHRGTGRVAALPDPDAAPRGLREVACVVRVGEDGGQVPAGAVRAQVPVDREGADDHAGVHPVVRIPEALEFPEQPHHLGPVHARQELRAGVPVAVFARVRAAMAHHQVRGLFDEPPEPADARAAQQVEVDADVDATLAEVPVRDAAQAVPLFQLAEVPQVRAEPLGRHGCVLPAGPRLGTVGHAGGDAGAFLADPPQRALRGGVGDDARLPLDVLGHAFRRGFGVRHRLAAQLHEQPGVAFGETAGHPAAGHEIGVDALHRERLVRQDRRRGVGRGAVVREPEHEENSGFRRLDQGYRCLQHSHAGALGADQRARDVPATLGQQLVKRVAGDLAREAAELPADQREVGVHEIAQLRRCAGTDGEPRAVVPQHVEGLDLVRRLAPAHRVGSARVVADHAAERAAAVRGRVGAEGEPVHGGGLAEAIQDEAGLDDRAACGRIKVDQRIDVLRQVEDDAAADRVAGHARAAASRGERHVELATDPDRRYDILFVTREHDTERHAPVVRRVGAVERAGGRAEVDLAAQLAPKPPRQPLRIHWPSLAPAALGDKRASAASRNVDQAIRHDMNCRGNGCIARPV